MNELIEGFLKMAEENGAALSVESLMSEEERFEWETLVKAFDSIDVMNVGRDLKKIHKTFKIEEGDQVLWI
jgi:hypothetical protein